MFNVQWSMACTNFIVGKQASADGSVFVTYNADSYGAFMPLYHYPAAKHQPGDMRKVYEWDTNKYLGEIAEAPETYNVIGNSNEWQVTIGETTFGGREEMVDSTGIIDYGSLIYITLQRAKTAREALQIMTSLVEQYGYCSEGETFSVADKDEAWMLEMMGCGPDRTKEAGRTVWVAVRIPDDAIAAHANQSRITHFLDGRYTSVKMKDLLKKYPNAGKKPVPNLVCYSDNIIRYARTMGWFDGKDAEKLIKNGVKYVIEISNMGCTPEAIEAFQAKKIPFAPGKAANAGGVAVSGLEMSQNAEHLKWKASEVDDMLKTIMKNIFDACVREGKQKNGYIDYVKGANIAGFKKVADAMCELGY